MDSTATAPRRQGSRKNGKPIHVSMVPPENLRPSPENNALYRPVDPADPEIIAMADSMKAYGVQQHFIATADLWLTSGHRRLVAAKLAGLAAVPCKVLDFRKDEDHDRFMQLLRECNRQRVKSFDEKLREETLSASPEVAYQSLIEYRETQTCPSLDTLDIRDEKKRCEITSAKGPFLEAIQKIIRERKKFWPLSDRQIHYGLLNDPPLTHASKPNSTYRNDKDSYKSLTELVTRARIVGDIPMNVIADPTRPVTVWNVHRDVGGYLAGEVNDFCRGYWRDLMQSQPNHIELIGEKNTVASTIRPVAAKCCIPMTIGRGYCSLRPRYDIAQRFRKSGKERLVLLMLSDFDPDGEEIAHSFARSLRDDFGIENIEPVKVALTADQVDEFALPPLMKAKKRGKKEYEGVAKRFVDQHGDDVWELEALPPATLQRLLQETVDSVIDVDAFNHELDAEKTDAAKLEAVRAVMLDTFRGWNGEEGR